MTILINSIPIESFNFPGGECSVKIPEICFDRNAITAYLYSSNDIMKLLLTVDAIRRIYPMAKITLIIPYFPYARQDRVCNQGEALSVKIMANLINGLNCDEVIIYDPHSDVTSALINNCHTVDSLKLINGSILFNTIEDDQNLIFISPDNGAEKKVRNIAKYFNRRMICATKVRDIATGEIIDTHIMLRDHIIVNPNQNLLIIDDICDGGRTFIEIAKKLVAQRPKGNLYLYVTHGIFSKGLDPLKEYFNKVFCYHTMLPSDRIDRDFLTIIGERHAD